MIRKAILTSAPVFLPFALFAHGSHGSGIMAGITHPIFGLDHAIAILGIGFLGALLNKSRWYIPLMAFLLPMIIAGYFGISQEATFLIEKVIAFSVFLIGIFIVFHEKLNANLILIPIAIFGGFHGFAHGCEMPEATTGLVYITGYSIGTLIMGTIGAVIFKGFNSNENRSQLVNSICGFFIAGCGLMIILG